ncbi:MAG TPA: NADH pyrophosphatase zinc ribbon domain-containing protein [Anaerolineales bacterium]|nr:NADH pyrophosphatase zinc ribbon domain-containing protein [Anaerolineales bacterium]
MTEYDNDLLREGILRFKAGETDNARGYLERALDNADDDETRCGANYYLSKLTDDPVRKRQYLEDVLAIDMTHAGARRDLAILDGKIKPEQIVDPDALPAQAAGTESLRADRFTCPKCGGRMVYSPDGSSLVCESCKQREAHSGGAESGERDFFAAMATGLSQRRPVSVTTFACQGCGASFMLAPNEISATCAYCGSVHVIATGERRELLEPDAILPLAFDRKKAVGYLVEWVEKNKLQPEQKVQPPNGLYLPIWVFDILGTVPWKGYRVLSKNGQRTNLLGLDLNDVAREPVSGGYPVQFANVCVTGMHKLSELLVKVLPEYDFGNVPAYDARYLAGWPAEMYDISMADASLDARKIAVDQVRRNIKSDLAQIEGLTFSASNIQVSGFRLVLVPVWVTRLTVQEKTALVLINGLTGSVHSELPGHGLAGWLGELLGS